LECNYIVQAANILQGLIPGEEASKPADANHLEKLFIFSIMWSIGALLELADRKKVF
jgi:dynein heavy chain